MFSVSPGKIPLKASVSVLVGWFIPTVDGESADGSELGFDSVQPGGVGGCPDRFDVVGCVELSDQVVSVGYQVVHHEIDGLLHGIAGAQTGEGRQEVFVGFLLPDLANQTVGVNIIEGQKLFGALHPCVCRPQPLGPALGVPPIPAVGAKLQGTHLVEADHYPV